MLKHFDGAPKERLSFYFWGTDASAVEHEGPLSVAPTLLGLRIAIPYCVVVVPALVGALVAG